MDLLGKADQRVLTALESAIPLEKRPFRTLARAAGMDEGEFIDRTRRLIDVGVIRRLAVLFDSRALGFSTTLVAARARSGRLAEAVTVIDSFEEVTHNYRRSGGRFEIWFTLSAPERGSIEAILARLGESGLFEEIMEVPALKVYKTRVRFKGLAGGEAADG